MVTITRVVKVETEQYELLTLTVQEFKGLLAHLGLCRQEFADLTGIRERTIRSWVSKEGNIPMVASNLLRAWAQLHDLGQPWKPGTIIIKELP